jgi:hypothetical protein
MKPRIMYIERKAGEISGPARIGRVTFSKSGRSIYYRRQCFKLFKGGFKSNCFDVDTGDEYWISGCKRNGGDRLYPGKIEIDDDIREEYWTEIRQKPEARAVKVIRCPGKYGGE